MNFQKLSDKLLKQNGWKATTSRGIFNQVIITYAKLGDVTMRVDLEKMEQIKIDEDVLKKLPTYSDRLITFARNADRSELASHAAIWYLEYQEESDEREWIEERLDLLEENNHEMRKQLSLMIKEESEKYFTVEIDENGINTIPDLIKTLMEPYVDLSVWCEKCNDKQKITDIAKIFSSIFHVVVFDSDLHLIPKKIPEGVIEIWWRQFMGSIEDPFYRLALKRDNSYGWYCFGHER